MALIAWSTQAGIVVVTGTPRMRAVTTPIEGR
jgi:hypothetical protein